MLWALDENRILEGWDEKLFGMKAQKNWSFFQVEPDLTDISKAGGRVCEFK